jgi:hypothetical protein
LADLVVGFRREPEEDDDGGSDAAAAALPKEEEDEADVGVLGDGGRRDFLARYAAGERISAGGRRHGAGRIGSA